MGKDPYIFKENGAIAIQEKDKQLIGSCLFPFKFPGNTDEDHFCLKLVAAEKMIQLQSSYFVGVQWLRENELFVHVYPKFDKEETVEVDYLKMLRQAFSTTESIKHLNQLTHIDFDQPSISIDQKDDLLTPLLVIQYMQLLKHIVQKGLKKSYFRVNRNLRSRVKGKVMVNETIKTNHARQKMLHTVCTYDEFGVDHLENRLLKKAFVFGQRALEGLRKAQPGVDALDESIRYVSPAFQMVGDELDHREVRHFKTNPLYKEYEEALKLAKLILKRYGYNITKTESAGKVETPPFWIDMSKLFELYVLQKLKEKFPVHGEVIYQPSINGRYPDYLIKSTDGDYKVVVDAKYKKYNSTNVNIEDIRQIAGYARMTGVYGLLGLDLEKSKNIDCLIIYPDVQNDVESFEKMKFLNDKNKLSNYEGIFKIGVALPLIRQHSCQ